MHNLAQQRAGRNTQAAILAELRDFFNQDGRSVNPTSVHPNGFTFSAGVFSFGLELDEPELLDYDQYASLDWQDTYTEPEF